MSLRTKRTRWAPKRKHCPNTNNFFDIYKEKKISKLFRLKNIKLFLNNEKENDILIDWNKLSDEMKLYIKNSNFEEIIKMNLIKIINTTANDGDLIIDFCGGNGWISIVLACIFPKLNFLLIDLFESDIKEAKNEVNRLKLKNYSAICGNINEITPQNFKLAI